jgi:penicillin-binding protein-related factor A (putative recombinase)
MRGIFAWKNQSTGIFDPSKKTFRKRSRFQINGVSDILCCYRGHFVAIEVKSEKGRLSESQIEFISKINAHGGFAFVARSVEDVEKAFKQIDSQLAQQAQLVHQL